MQIMAYDIETAERCSIEIPIRRLTALDDLKQAAYWRKLLELVQHLQSHGTEHELAGQIILDDLYLYKPEPPDPVRAKAIQKFMDEWRQSNPGSQPGNLYREIQKRFPLKEKTKVIVRIDWMDWVPLQDFVSVVHYRLQIKHPGKVLSEDARAKTPMEAERVILRAFGW
jgi:hypothetical protein